MKRALLWTLSVWLTVAISAAEARADQEPDLFGRAKKPAAMKELDTGNKLYKQREFERAIDFYKSGQLIEDAPIFLYNIGQCYRQLGDYEQAIWFYERWLSAYKPDASNPARQAVEKWLVQMRAELEGKARTEPPLDAASGRESREDATDADTSADSTDPLAIPPPASDREPWYADALGWGLVASGVAVVATGGGLLGSGASRQRDANNDLDEMRRDKLRDEADTRRLAGAFVTGVGAVLVIGGAVSFAIPSKKEEPSRGAWIQVSPNGLAVGGRF